MGGPGDRRERRGAGARPGPAGSRRDRRPDALRDGPVEGGDRGIPPGPRRAAGQRRGPHRPRTRASQTAGDQAAAEAVFRRAIELEPSFAVFNQLGAWYYDFGRYAEAADLFRRASRTAPDSYWAQSNLGGAEAMRCDFPAALVAFRRALELAPKDPSALSNLGMAQLWTGHPADAVASLERAVVESPGNFMIVGNLGDAYRARGDPAKADRAYARSVALARAQLDLNPKDAFARSYVATGLAKTGHMVEANQEMARVIALDPKEPDLFSDAAIVAALAGRDAEAFAWLRKAVAAGYCRQTSSRCSPSSPASATTRNFARSSPRRAMRPAA